MGRRRIGFTTRASCLLAAGATAILCGIVLGETDLLRAGLFAIAVPVVAAVVVHRARLRVANRRTVDPPRVTAGDAVTVSLAVTNRSVLPSGALMLEDELPARVTGRARFTLDSLSSRESRTVAYRLPGLGRGRYRIGPLHIRLADPFRMVDLTRSFSSTTEFLVTPTIDDLPPVEPPRSDDVGGSAGSHSVGAHGADDASTREYRIGDDLRKIHWRSSARTGQLDGAAGGAALAGGQHRAARPARRGPRRGRADATTPTPTTRARPAAWSGPSARPRASARRPCAPAATSASSTTRPSRRACTSAASTSSPRTWPSSATTARPTSSRCRI